MGRVPPGRSQTSWRSSSVSTNDPARLGKGFRLWFLVKDTFLYGAAAAISKLSGLILFPLLTQNFSVAEYGRIDLILYGAMFFGLLTVFGQDSAVARYFFEEEERPQRQQLISQALAVILLNGLLSICALLAIARLPIAVETGGDDRLIVMLLVIYAPLTGLASFCQGILKWTFQRLKYITVSLGLPLTNLALIYMASLFGNLTIIQVLSIMMGVSLTFVLLGLFFIRQWLVLPRDTQFARKLLPLAIPYGLIAATSALVPLFERSMVTAQFGSHELGLYAAGAKIASLALLISTAFQMGWGPFSYAIYKERDAADTYNLVFRLFAVAICVTVLALSAIGGPLIRFLASQRYQGSELFVFPLAMAIGVQAIGWITEIGIHLSKKTYLNLIGFGLYLLASVVGILLLAKVMGIVGIALGALLGQIVMALTSGIIAQRVYNLSWRYGMPVATVGVTILTGAAAYMADRLETGVAGTAVYACGIMFVLAFNMLFGISSSDWRSIRALRHKLGSGSAT